MKYTIPKEMTLLEALKTFFPDSSRRTLSQWMEYGRVFIDGTALKKANTPVNAGQELHVGEKEQAVYYKGINILFQDRHLIVIDKPTSLLSVASEQSKEEHALHFLREHFKTNGIFAVHRLDRETSGVLLFARGSASEEYFDGLFERHDLTRQYFAIVEGRLKEDKGTWVSYLTETENFNVITTDEENGRQAITHFEVIRRSKKFTYLKLELETGRKHQIRVHCSAAGHPVVGDKRYGSSLNPIGRLGLHAALLRFKHPITKKEMEFTSPLPKAFAKLVN